MRAACINNPYQFNYIYEEEIKDFRTLASQFVWKNMPILQVREITFDPSDSELVTFKRDFAADEEPACFLKFLKNKRFQECFDNIRIKTCTQ